MLDLPDGWELRRTDEVGDVQLGRQRSPSHAAGPHMRPYLRVANVFDGYIDYSDVLEMNFTPSEYKVFSLRVGDILLNEGQSLELVGRNSVYGGLSGMCFQNTLVRFRPRLVTSEFSRAVFKYWFDSGVFRRIARQTTSIAHLGADRFAALPFPVPSAWEQRRIAEILGAIDDSIRASELTLSKSSIMLDGMIDSLMRRGIDAEGRMRCPVENPGVFTSSELGLVPRDWVVAPLGNFIRLQRGFDITAAEQMPGVVPVVTSSGITSYHNVAMVQGPGVVTGRKGKLGKAYYVDNDFWPHDTSLWVTNFGGNDRKFVSYLISWLRLERLDAATSVPTLNRNSVHPKLIAMPEVKEQKRIVETIEVGENKMQTERACIAKLELLKRGLAGDLLRGRVRFRRAL